jgi:DNA invertase Pin-like site-specific DNA recombinase
MTTAIYACVSTKDKDQTNDNQLRELRAFAERLSGWATQSTRSTVTRKAGAALSGPSSSNSL